MRMKSLLQAEEASGRYFYIEGKKFFKTRAQLGRNFHFEAFLNLAKIFGVAFCNLPEKIDPLRSKYFLCHAKVSIQ